jgi:hypothetical protein
LCENSGTPSPCRQPPDAYRHDGFYLRIGSGFGFGMFSGTGPTGKVSISGLSVGSPVAVGGNVGEGFVIALAVSGTQINGTVDGSRFPDAKATASLAMLGLLADWFPDPTGGWHAGGTVALGAMQITDIVTDANPSAPGVPSSRDQAGLCFAGGIFGGHDWWIGQQWSLGLALVASGATSATLADRDGAKTGYSLSALSVGLQSSFTLH